LVNTVPAKQQFLVDVLPQVGPTRAENLLEEFGSVQAVLGATPEELEEVPRIGSRLAELISNFD